MSPQERHDELVARARLYSENECKQVARMIMANAPMADDEYTELFRQSIESAFVIGHAAGMVDGTKGRILEMPRRGRRGGGKHHAG